MSPVVSWRQCLYRRWAPSVDYFLLPIGPYAVQGNLNILDGAMTTARGIIDQDFDRRKTSIHSRFAEVATAGKCAPLLVSRLHLQARYVQDCTQNFTLPPVPERAYRSTSSQSLHMCWPLTEFKVSRSELYTVNFKEIARVSNFQFSSLGQSLFF